LKLRLTLGKGVFIELLCNGYLDRIINRRES